MQVDVSDEEQVIAKPTCILLVGMHRSGTSAFARILNLMGAALPKEIMPAAPSNPTGHWEPDRIVRYHDSLLLPALESSWDDWQKLDFESGKKSPNSRIISDLLDLIRTDFDEKNLFVLKDPRIARLIPLYKRALLQAGIDVRFLVPFRHPISVIASLKNRDGITEEFASLLWLRHVVDAEVESRGKIRALISYESLLADWKSAGRMLREHLGISGQLSGDAESQIEEFLSRDLCHHQHEVRELMADRTINPWIKGAYTSLLRLERDPNDVHAFEEIDRIRRELDEAGSSPATVASLAELRERGKRHTFVTNKLSAELEAQSQKILRQTSELEAKKNETATVAAECDELMNLLREERQRAIALSDLLRDHSAARVEVEHQLESVLQQLEAIQSSSSWKLISPLRNCEAVIRDAARSIKRNPYRRALSRNLRRSFKSWSFRDFGGDNFARAAEVITVDDSEGMSALPNFRLAVHAHIFYPDLMSEIGEQLATIPIPFDGYFTTDDAGKLELIRPFVERLPNCKEFVFRVIPNRGRDVAPMFVDLGVALSQYDIVAHIHTKRSPHNLQLRGWRSYLLESMFGNSRNVGSILRLFARRPELGLLYPDTFHPVKPFMRIGANEQGMRYLLQRARLDPDLTNIIPQDAFPSGFMFWARGAALNSTVELKLAHEDFESESAQVDGTLAHALERLLPTFVRSSGYVPAKFTQAGTEVVGTSPPTRRPKSQSIALLLDHNIGGGTNVFTQQLVGSLLAEKKDFLRAYFDQGGQRFIAHFVDARDGGIYALRDSAAFQEFAGSLPITSIHVNSLFSVPDIGNIVNLIKMFARRGCKITYYMHDFNCVCPSQHLLNWVGSYCGVPDDAAECGDCFKKNLAIPPDIREKYSIREWRGIFQELINLADEIQFFDPSGVGIASRALQIQPQQIMVRPHAPSCELQPLPPQRKRRMRIGLLGTMTEVKGADVVNRLASYLIRLNLPVDIVLVGSTLVRLHESVVVHGAYDIASLRHIVEANEIGVFLFPTIVPETFSYALTEMMQLGLGIVAFDMGAQGNRLRQYKRGMVLPPRSSSHTLFGTLKRLYEANNEVVEVPC